MPSYKRRQQIAPEDLSQQTLSYITEFVGLNMAVVPAINVGGSDGFSRAYNVVATQQVVQGTTSPTVIYTQSIAGGLFGTTGCFVLQVDGTYLNSSGSASTFTVKLVYGADTLYEDASASLASQSLRTPLNMLFRIFATGSTGTQGMSGEIARGDRNTAVTTGLGSHDSEGAIYPIQGDSAVDSTVNQDLVLTVTHSHSSSSTSYHMNYARLTKLNS